MVLLSKSLVVVVPRKFPNPNVTQSIAKHRAPESAYHQILSENQGSPYTQAPIYIYPPAPLGAIRLRGEGVFNGSSVNDCPSSPPVLLSWNVFEVFSDLPVRSL